MEEKVMDKVVEVVAAPTDKKIMHLGMLVTGAAAGLIITTGVVVVKKVREKLGTKNESEVSEEEVAAEATPEDEEETEE